MRGDGGTQPIHSASRRVLRCLWHRPAVLRGTPAPPLLVVPNRTARVLSLRHSPISTNPRPHTRTGVPGIGKTLTLRELARTASADWGVRRVVALNCMKNPDTVPHQILDGLGGAAQYLDGEKATVRAVRVARSLVPLFVLVPVLPRCSCSVSSAVCRTVCPSEFQSVLCCEAVSAC